MDDLGEVGIGDASHLQELLAHGVEPSPLPAHGGEERRARPSVQEAGPASGNTRKVGLVGLLRRSHPVGVEVERSGEADRLGRHGVADPPVLHEAGGPTTTGKRSAKSEDGIGEGRRRGPLHGEALGGDDPGRPTGPLLVGLAQPLGELP